MVVREQPRSVSPENPAQEDLCIRRCKTGTPQGVFHIHNAIMPPMVIGIDCRFASTHTGLGRYTRELVTHLLLRKDDVQYVLFVHPGDHQWLPQSATNHYTLITHNAGHYSFSEQWKFPWIIKRSGIHLFFCPHFNIPLICPVPFVATIHDLILHRYPNQVSLLRRAAYRLLMRHTVKRAKALIAVSKFTADELVKTYGKDLQKKTTVIHQAASSEFARKSAAACGPVLKNYDLRKPFFLYVGNAKEHKNVQMLIDAYRSLESTETELVLVTGGKESEALRLYEGIRMLRDIPASDLSCLYYFAAAFVTASLYEGFGLPVLEAAASGCPVIVTDRGSLPEIAPPGSRIITPTVEDVAEALREPPSPSDPGKMRTWGEVAEETFAVFHKCLMTNH